MKRYLVPYDGSALSKAALKYAILFSKCVSGAIDICYIADERALANPIFDLTVMALQVIGTLGDLITREKVKLELKAKLISRGEDILEEIKKWPELAGDSQFNYTTRVEVANPPIYLSKVSENYDIIFMGLWGEMRDFKAGLWGGTSEAVIRNGKSHTLLATADFKPISEIVVGFDNRPRARQALAWAGMIGESMRIPVNVVVCGTDPDFTDKIVSEAQVIAPSYDTGFSYFTMKIHAAEGILSVSGEKPGALICMGAFGDQPLREFFLGSVAEEVLRRSDGPVMLFK